MFLKIIKYFFWILLLTCYCHFAQSQSKGIAEIEKALKENQVDKANGILQSITNQYIKEQQADSLVKYIFYTGKVSRSKSNLKTAEIKMLSLMDKIKNISSNPSTLRQACIEAGEFYGSVGMNTAGYKMNEKVLKYTLQMPGQTGNQKAATENNLSTYAQRMGDINLAKRHSRNSLKYLLAEANPDYETLYVSYNGMGSMMWHTSKTDSALYYYEKALETLDKMERTPRNSLFRPAIVLNNLSAIYQLKGKMTQAIKTMELTIGNLKKYIVTGEPDYKKATAITFQLEATDNLGGIYKEIGDLKKAEDLLEYSYQQKQKTLTPNDPAIFISQILLGQLYYATRDYNKSLQFLNIGLQKIASSDGDYLFWQADACNTLAQLYDSKHDIQQAALYYERADSLYEQSLQGEYDNIYLEFLRNAALFYAENNQPKIAIAKANKGYRYVVKTQGAHTLIAFYQLLNLSEVNYLSGRYHETLDYSKKSLIVVNNIIGTSNNLLDSIRMELKKPKAVLQKTKAEYQLLKTKDATTLSAMLNELNDALLLLERQKTIINDYRDISILMADNTELIEFIKKITLELYNTTHNPVYIDRLVSLHESGMYNRIRSRLDKNDSLQFANIPLSLQKNERDLKTAMATALKEDGTHDEKIQRYLKAIENWNSYQKKIKKEYPSYYKMRYASIFKTSHKVEKYIPTNLTLIRYFFIEKNLYALVAENQQKQLFDLGENDFSQLINWLSDYGMDETKTSDILYSLYQKLWSPFAKNIHHKKIVIIPDGILYNLNFEILTPGKISGFRDLATNSLLTNYTISYNYSLFLLDNQIKSSGLTNNFVAFAPGFSDKIKNEYRQVSRDSTALDKGYLSLLPQPFSIGLAKKINKILGGKTFINEESTKNTFVENAGNTRIIHIGTHAESNNDYPEFSRLIFAKNISTGDTDNSLFVDEIYNYNLTSQLAVLTACESGRPGFQDGEGMISLAHAFNYAGSESILTGLWKIDEQASALLLDIFYRNLLKGMDKDEALRQAKLSYLKHAEGRMLSPQYWAGLVIMGDTSPVLIATKNNKIRILIPVILILLLGSGYFFLKKK
ncbi:MAG: CHAT domain-containing tetratricopeptide repeat protein [Ginsengibacter sp.]